MWPVINSIALIGGKFILKNPLHDLLSSLNAVISTNESTWVITGHVIYNLAYTYKFQLKTTILAIWDPKKGQNIVYNFWGTQIVDLLLIICKWNKLEKET